MLKTKAMDLARKYLFKNASQLKKFPTKLDQLDAKGLYTLARTMTKAGPKVGADFLRNMVGFVTKATKPKTAVAPVSICRIRQSITSTHRPVDKRKGRFDSTVDSERKRVGRTEKTQEKITDAQDKEIKALMSNFAEVEDKVATLKSASRTQI